MTEQATPETTMAPATSVAPTVVNEHKELITKLAIVSVFIFLILGVLGIGYLGYTKYQEHRAEQLAIQKEAKHQAAQAYIRDMIAFCDFAKLKTEELATVEKCGDDVEAARFALQTIISDREIFWKSRVEDITERMGKLLNLKRNADYWSISNENQFKEVGSKLVREYETAVKQRDFWVEKGQELKTFTPKAATSKTLESKPSSKSDPLA